MTDSDQLDPREAAEAAYTPNGPSIDDLENEIRAARGLPLLRQPRQGNLPTFEECIDRAGRTLAVARATAATRTPREQAEAAWHIGSPYSIDELEDLIRMHRGLSAVHGNDLAELESRNSFRRARREDPEQ